MKEKRRKVEERERKCGRKKESAKKESSTESME
jgi:hypothetical protein